jgi:hypothetical protein
MLSQKNLSGFDQIGVESAAQPFVGGDQKNAVTLIATRIQQRMMKILRCLRREVLKHLAHLLSEGTRIKHAVLRPAQLRRRDHFHGLGDLLGILNRLNSPANV